LKKTWSKTYAVEGDTITAELLNDCLSLNGTLRDGTTNHDHKLRYWCLSYEDAEQLWELLDSALNLYNEKREEEMSGEL
jgi:hypothetical protein